MSASCSGSRSHSRSTKRGRFLGEYQGWAVYGDTKWQLTDSLDLSVGARYTADERDGTVDIKGQGFLFSV